MTWNPDQRSVSICLDKIEQEYLQALCTRTGKNQDDVVKLALALLHNNLCNEKAPTITWAPFVPIQYPQPIVIQQPAVFRVEPNVFPLEPFPNTSETIWMGPVHPNTGCCGNIDYNNSFTFVTGGTKSEDSEKFGTNLDQTTIVASKTE